MNENVYNFILLGNSDIYFNNQIDITNLVNGKPVYYIRNAADTVYDSSTNAGTFYVISGVNVTLKDLDLKTNYHGILFWNTTDSNIQNVNVSDNHDGIYLQSSCNNTLSGNNVTSNYYGIYLESSSNNNNLTSNNATSNTQRGIYLYSSDYNRLSDNNASNNNYGTYLYSSDYNILCDNNVNSNSYGIYLESSSNNNNLTSNNATSNTQRGIHLYSSDYNTLSDNNASNNNYGIYLQSTSKLNNITNNIVSNNNNYGIYLQLTSDNNTISNNYFNNSNNAFDSGYNTWNTTPTIGTNIIGGSWLGGNYWSDYDGVDTDNDDLGDTLTPYNSSSNITYGGDYHPLIYILPEAPLPPSSSSGSVGVGSSDEPENVEETVVLRIYLQAGESSNYNFNDVVTSVDVTPDKTYGLVAAKIEVLKGRPGSITTDPPAGEIYKYVDVFVGTSGWSKDKFSSSVINFQIPASWFEENNIDPASVTLCRHNNDEWQSLTTTLTGQADGFYKYSSPTPGFSTFMILGQVEGSSDVEPAAATALGTVAEPKPTQETTSDKGIPGFGILAGIVGVMMAVYSRKK